MKLSKALTPEVISEEDRRLVIPIYQRLFVWGQEKIGNLLDDLWSASNADDKKDYYIGVITIHENDKQEWEIVDGQQRLTFLTLLGCMCGSHFPGWGKFVWRNQESDGDGREIRLFFHGRDEDRDDILQFENRNDFKRPAFACFKEQFERFVKDNDGKTERDLEKFADYCFHHIAFLVNVLPEEYGPDELNFYFEKMNSTGRQLSPIEVVKGKWFANYAAEWNACMNFDKAFVSVSADENSEANGQVDGGYTLQSLLSESHSEAIIDGPQEQGTTVTNVKNRLVMREDILALHVLQILFPEKEISMDRSSLIVTFKAHLDAKIARDTDAIGKYIEVLKKYRKWIDENIIYLKDDGGEYEYAFRNDADNGDDAIEDDDKRWMRQFQSMKYVASDEPQKWVLDAYKEHHDEKLKLEHLRSLDANDRGDPDAAYMRYHSAHRYWFWKLDFLLWEKFMREGAIDGIVFENKESCAIKNYKFRRDISIEHLHPQSIENDNWGRRSDPNSKMHGFGNLAMISQGANSAQSNDGIGTKFGRVKDWLDSGRLESIKMLLMFKACEGAEEKWTTELAKTHGEAMLELLKADRAKWLKNDNAQEACAS